MTRVPRPAAMPATSAGLRRMFPGWTFSYDPRGIWSAEKRTGTALEVHCADTALALAIKLDKIEAGRWVTRNSGPDYRSDR